MHLCAPARCARMYCFSHDQSTPPPEPAREHIFTSLFRSCTSCSPANVPRANPVNLFLQRAVRVAKQAQQGNVSELVGKLKSTLEGQSPSPEVANFMHQAQERATAQDTRMVEELARQERTDQERREAKVAATAAWEKSEAATAEFRRSSIEQVPPCDVGRVFSLSFLGLCVRRSADAVRDVKGQLGNKKKVQAGRCKLLLGVRIIYLQQGAEGYVEFFRVSRELSLGLLSRRVNVLVGVTTPVGLTIHVFSTACLCPSSPSAGPVRLPAPPPRTLF